MSTRMTSDRLAINAATVRETIIDRLDLALYAQDGTEGDMMTCAYLRAVSAHGMERIPLAEEAIRYLTENRVISARELGDTARSISKEAFSLLVDVLSARGDASTRKSVKEQGEKDGIVAA